MAEQQDLLIEIGTEELPPKALYSLMHAFAGEIRTGLEQAGLAFSDIQPFASPRRLAVVVTALEVAQQDRVVERRGPAIAAAFDDEGCPTKAAEGFARSCGVTVEQLETLETDKGSWLAYQVEEKGRKTAELLPDIIRRALKALPIPKRMRWGNLDAEFVRPVHWAVLLLGDDVIPAEILGVTTGRDSRGHRFHHPDTIAIKEPATYVPQLETEGRVIVDFEARKQAIRGMATEAATAAGGIAVIDEDLLTEVTSMVEWPVAVQGSFDARFLDVPQEALISSMKNHQKYFHVIDNSGKLLPAFITISNIDSKQPEMVQRGNERVIRPRLTDAEFFWQQDRKQPLSHHIEHLKDVVFQKQLGTLYDKSQRIAALAEKIAGDLGSNTEYAVNAAQLAKCDLMTDMVYEFPELQGIMGRYYAQHDGEAEEVAGAIEEHYLPRFAGDVLPATATGQAVALADKLDTLVGIFAIGQAPTGDKDPFALRRAALGVLRISIESDLALNLRELIEQAADNYQRFNKITIKDASKEEVFDFILGRLHVSYANKGFSRDEIDAVISLRPAQLNELDKRLHAVKTFRAMKEAESLAAANKRCHNLLKKAIAEGIEVPESVNTAKLSEAAEKSLADSLSDMQDKITPLLADSDYQQALKNLATLRESVDAFFDNVMVMVEDKTLRNNRLALLQQLRNLFLKIADISCLQE